MQEIIGQRFNPAYIADQASWRAAEMIDDFRQGVSPRHLLWLITGRLRRAHALLVERAGRDRYAMHGTAIGMHGIVHALDRMRALRSQPGADSLTEDVAVGRCLVAPSRVPRTVEREVTTAATARPQPSMAAAR